LKGIREDPRYFRGGSASTLIHRILYAMSRVADRHQSHQLRDGHLLPEFWPDFKAKLPRCKH
jgi:hypothetical protein